jgi:hypothetical protein
MLGSGIASRLGRNAADEPLLLAHLHRTPSMNLASAEIPDAQ